MSNCDCSISTWDLDTPTLHESKIVKARTKHVCRECRSTIMPGEKYERVKGLWEESFQTHKTCLPCMRIRNHYCSSGFIYGELRETLINCLDIDYLKSEEL